MPSPAGDFPILLDLSEPVSFPPLGPNVKVLMVWPRFPPSFWGFEGVLEMLPEAAISPPLGLITVAALCPPAWTIRLVDRAFEDLRDEDLLWADLVMVSAMFAQRADAIATLARARSFGRRTFIGGPWASSQPELLLKEADHVLAGEAEVVFGEIAAALEQGTAQSLYRVSEKPDMSRSPLPRFDLLRLNKYAQMPVQFSRGCPFQCEFCDIITIYGRKPRSKPPAQVIAELDALYRLGWRNEVFIVDDNFIGNSKRALELAGALKPWQELHGYPFAFSTEASIDLADRPELLAAMVEANFMYVFIGIETPSAEALKASRKFQNLRSDNVQQIRVIQQSGLWVLAGFIVGFDSDDQSIFERQREFIERTAIAWAMAGVLQALPTTPLFDRMKREGRLNESSQATSNFSAPDFRTIMPLPVLLHGLSGLLVALYTPQAFFARAFRSLEVWRPRATQRPPNAPLAYTLRVLFASVWTQGIRSDYRLAYWRFLGRMAWNWWRQPAKLWLGFMVLLSAHHFVLYAREVADELERECNGLHRAEPSPASELEAAGLQVV
ncbi:MAG: B12-binding domain-containing radical SAM protein [Bryobacteraceae bacterium]|jgi:radical SAM superfamily enzyme YgiQ (UPF0313 family)